MLRADPPDVVLLDLTLHGEDGLCAHVIDRREWPPRPIVVALTGHDDPATLERCRPPDVARCS